MLNSNSDDDHETERYDAQELQLACLLESLWEHMRGGAFSDVDELVAEYPEYAAELRELWATVLIAENIGESSRHEASDGVRETPTAVGNLDANLPRQVGDYELLEEIGRGGMGVVFKARQISLQRIVAVKMILRGEFASATDVARFQSEAQSAGRLQHPHIVPVYEVGETDDVPFFSMKYIEGTTLANRVAEGPIPAREIAQLLLPVVRAIAQAHENGLLHRDLKPSNILIDQEQHPYVTDFGLAKQWTARTDENRGDATVIKSLTQSGAILGTPGYMAPEQAAGQRGRIGPQTDIYSLGALLYAMLTGRAPFQAASPVDTVLMVLEQDPLPPRLLNPKADRDLEMIALKCLQKPTDLRYARAADVAADLQAFLAHEPISARSSKFTQVLSRAFRETHHVGILENWGLLWMWHAVVLLILCLMTSFLHWRDVQTRWPYLLLWTVGLGAWATIFWNVRRRSGPITFVERQIAHVWGGSVISSSGLFVIEWILELPVLSLSPVLGLLAGMVFLAKAGILSGRFYVHAAILFATAAGMALLKSADIEVAVFGVVSGAAFFVPGLKYYRQRGRTERSVVHY